MVWRGSLRLHTAQTEIQDSRSGCFVLAANQKVSEAHMMAENGENAQTSLKITEEMWQHHYIFRRCTEPSRCRAGSHCNRFHHRPSNMHAHKVKKAVQDLKWRRIKKGKRKRKKIPHRFFRCCTEPRQRRAPAVMMARREQSASHSSMLCDVSTTVCPAHQLELSSFIFMLREKVVHHPQPMPIPSI